MRLLKGISTAMAIAGLCVSASTTALAGFTWEVGNVFNGDPPSGVPGPWATITGTQDGSTAVLTIHANNIGSVYIDSIYLNYSGVTLPAAGAFAVAGSGFTTPTVSVARDGFRADGDGIYDILIEFANANAGRLNNGDTATIRVANANVDWFNALSAPGPGGSTGPFPVVIKIQGYESSAWVTVPEPTTMVAGALLLLPFAASTIRRMRKSS